MVDSNSPTYKFSEKIFLVIEKGIRYIVIFGITVFIGGKLGGCSLFKPLPAPSAPPAPPL
ncbi:MAG: hypothetical protein ACI93P_002019 [bacterium]|jgi:hypothetical protein